ncbi:hypothetical protein ACOMHN_047088 [Nucella lapillus]
MEPRAWTDGPYQQGHWFEDTGTQGPSFPGGVSGAVGQRLANGTLCVDKRAVPTGTLVWGHRDTGPHFQVGSLGQWDSDLQMEPDVM